MEMLTHGPIPFRSEELFGDSRTYGVHNGPTRYVKLPRATPDGGAMSYSSHWNKVAIVGRESTWNAPNITFAYIR